MKLPILILSLFLLLSSCESSKKQSEEQLTAKKQSIDSIAVPLSKQLINSILANKETQQTVDKLKNLELNTLLTELNTDLKKKVFWINIYNSFIQVILKEDDKGFEDKSDFFSKKQIEIAGVQFSFDDIEHGIIRGTKFKYGLGYVDNPFSDEIIKALQCDTLDERIHFALNCGAESCPPVRVYTLSNFEKVMEENTKTFLSSETTFLEIENKVITTRLFQWYKGDFNLSVIEYLKKYNVIPQWVEADVEYSEYNWEKRLVK
ncbi:MAG: hypothetical protein CMC96_09010 [Flavobacteriales bacterium]|nr:hypothetical protein [Flavobacteriales bacterium]|tara:strand:- start:29953 stop:30738 length:786 start_codon:yes stop_codon:yes gene_type:complete